MRHHEETIAAFTASRAGRPDVVGVVVVGSVARGDERPDSDVDVYVVLTDEAYAAATATGEVAYVSHDGVTYDGGYVDVKLASPHYLTTAADHGDDPTRASFARARVVLDRSGEIAPVVGRMTDLPASAWAGRVQSYRAQLALYAGYFLGQADERGERFLLRHAAVHATFAAGRCALARHGRLFRGQKYLAADLAALPELPSSFLPAWWDLLETPTAAAGERLIAVVDHWLGDALSVDESLARFIADNELAWLHQTVPPEFW